MMRDDSDGRAVNTAAGRYIVAFHEYVTKEEAIAQRRTELDELRRDSQTLQGSLRAAIAAFIASAETPNDFEAGELDRLDARLDHVAKTIDREVSHEH